MTTLSEARTKAVRKSPAKKAAKRPHRKEKTLSDEEFMATLKPETQEWIRGLQRLFG